MKFHFTHIVSLCVLGLCACHSQSSVSQEKTATAKTGTDVFTIAIDPVDTTSIQRGILEAYQKGIKRVKIPAGTYRIPRPESDRWHLKFEKMQDFTIDATGVTFICMGKDRRDVGFLKCHNVTFKGATLINEVPPFSQGDVVVLSDDGATIDVKIHDGYPREIEPGYNTPILSVFDSVTGKLKRNVRDIHVKPNPQFLENGIVRFQARDLNELKGPNGEAAISKGDMVAWRRLEGSNLNVYDCSGISVIGVTMKNALGAAVVENNGDGGNYYNYTVTYADPPAGATKKPLLASSADGLISYNTRKGPTLENCFFEGLDDDGVNISGIGALVLEVKNSELIVDYREGLQPMAKAGDTMEVYDGDTQFVGLAKLVSIEDVSNDQATEEFYKLNGTRRYKDYSKAVCKRIILDKPVPAKPGFILVNYDKIGNGFVIRNCTVRNKRGHGFFIRAGEGIIENNTIEDTLFGGILIAPEFRSFTEVSYSRNLIIRNNTVRRTGLANQSWNGAILVAAFEASIGGSYHFVKLPGGHRNILVEGNRFEENDGPNMVISSVDGITIKNNVFVKPMNGITLHNGVGGMDDYALVWATEANNVKFEGNTVESPGVNMKRILSLTPTVSGAGFEDGIKKK